jgi:NAD(P)H-dependent flavin oxidoreductase YrpB (nitropropane dioxygenase family)
MKQLFKSRYPIVCAPMNGVSDVNLALACNSAGVVPSLIPYNYKNFKEFFTELALYKNATQGDIIVAIRLNEVVDDRLHDKLMTSGITHIELLEFTESLLTDDNINKIASVRDSGIKIILKILTHDEIAPFVDIIDAVTIKGPEAAGRSEDIDLISEIKSIRLQYPDLKIIASGGIKNSTDIQKYMSAGANAVSIGTLFAMSKESSIPDTVKNKLLQSNSSDIRRLKMGARQRAVIFDEHGNDDFNNTQGLYSGLATANSGHVFVGNAIDSVTEMLSVQEIVDHLVS